MDRKDFETGIILGLCLPPVPQVVRTPISYSYNGVVLPKLPEWDRSVYPYAFIFVGSVLRRLTVLPEARHLTIPEGSETAFITAEEGMSYMSASYYEGSAAWGQFTTYTAEETKLLSNSPHWANYDIKNPDETVYLEASNPVPVYE